jgi:hypothetical protein
MFRGAAPRPERHLPHPRARFTPGLTDRDLFLDTAARIGARLAARALWQGGVCAWELPTGHPQPGHLYRGTAGIALFLAELWKATGDGEIRRAAEGAARHAVRWSRRLGPEHPGLFNGRMGVAWAAARIGGVLGDEALAGEAAAGVRWAARVPPPAAADVIDGAAGVVLALLLLAPLAPGEPALETAAAWGRALAAAVPEPWGWSWPDPETPYVRNLLGYAHGASGAGHALLELAAATGAEELRYGAEQAFLYERRFFRPEHGNWPDFRYAPADAGAPGQRSAAPYHPRFRTAWCHGATGIGLARIRAFELLRAPLYAAEARAAVAAALGFGRDRGFNFSLCHGAAGTLELLCEAAAVLGEPELRARAEEMAAEGCEEFERGGREWPCGTGTGASDPALMLGEAGIGLTLLRLAGADAPSLVLPRAAETGTMPTDGGPEAARLAGAAVAAHFGSAMAAFRRLGRAPALRRPTGATPAVHVAGRALRARVDAEPDPRLRSLLADALAPELAAYEMTRGAIDRSEETWLRGAEEEPEWERGWIGLSGLARVVETAHDCAAWPEGADEPPEGPAHFLVVRGANRGRAHRLVPFAAAVLAALSPPRTLDEVAAAVADGFPPGTAPEPERLRAAIVGQLRAAWRQGAVRVTPVPPLEAALDRLAAAAAGEAPPAAIQARDAIARQVESARALLAAGDPLMAQVVAASTTSELEAALHAVHARPLFAEWLAAVHAAADGAARLEAFAALLDAVDSAFAPGEMLLPGVSAGLTG